MHSKLHTVSIRHHKILNWIFSTNEFRCFFVFVVVTNRVTMVKNAVHRQFIGFQNGLQMLFMFHNNTSQWRHIHTALDNRQHFFDLICTFQHWTDRNFSNKQWYFLIGELFCTFHIRMSAKQLNLFGEGNSFFFASAQHLTAVNSLMFLTFDEKHAHSLTVCIYSRS